MSPCEHALNVSGNETNSDIWHLFVVVNAVAALLEEVNQAVEEHKNKLPSDTSNEQVWLF